MSDIENAARKRLGERLVMTRMLILGIDQVTFADRFGLDLTEVRQVERAAGPASPKLLAIVEAIEAGDADLLGPSPAREVVSEPHATLTKVDIGAPGPNFRKLAHAREASEPHATFGNVMVRKARAADPDADKRARWRQHWADFRSVVDANRDRRVKEPLPTLPADLQGFTCGAKTRAGAPCKRTQLSYNGRCQNHGGNSTGPRSADGKRAARANLSLRWAGRSEGHAATANDSIGGATEPSNP